MTKPRDRVERETLVNASIERAFDALTNPERFPTWGPEAIDGKLAVGERPVFDFGYAGKVRVYIVALEAPRYFAYRWMQGVYDPEVLLGDPLGGPNTLVEFRLEATEAGTRVRVTESEIDKLPAPEGLNVEERLEQMGKGWELMVGGLPRHFASTATGDDVTHELTVRVPRERVHDAIVHPARWWIGAPPLVVVSDDPGHLQFNWPRGDTKTLVDIHLDELPDGTRIRVHETGHDTALNVRRARYAWGVVLDMLDHHLS